MGTVRDEHFDVIVECLQDSIRQDATQMKLWENKGHKKHASTIEAYRKQARKKLAAIDFIKQQGWEPTPNFPDMSHHWEDVL